MIANNNLFIIYLFIFNVIVFGTTKSPTRIPTFKPSSYKPTQKPTKIPSSKPTLLPTNEPTFLPTLMPTITPPDLISHWNFDENGPDWHDDVFGTIQSTSFTSIADVVGSNNGQVFGDTKVVSGKQYTALQLNSNGYILLPVNLANILVTKSMSLSYWFQLTQSPTTLFNYNNAPAFTGARGSNGIVFGWIDNEGYVCLSINDNLVLKSITSVIDKQWHHVVFTRNINTGYIQLFIDGKLEDSEIGDFITNPQSFSSFGKVSNFDQSDYIYFQSKIDQIHIYNDTISQSIVELLYKNHAPKCWNVVTETGVTTKPFITTSVLTRCFDVEDNPISVVSWTQPSYGIIIHNGDGSFTYNSTISSLTTAKVDTYNVIVKDNAFGYYTAKCNILIQIDSSKFMGTPTTFNQFSPAQYTSDTPILYGTNMRVPRLYDWNFDGKLDLLIGYGGYIYLHLNDGSNKYSTGSKLKLSTGAFIYSGDGTMTFTLYDIDNDGFQDLIFIDNKAKIRYYKNFQTNSNTSPIFTSFTYLLNATSNLPFTSPSSERRFDIGDWDSDGIPDLILGARCQNVILYSGISSTTGPQFTNGQTIIPNVCYNVYPRLYDLNNNGQVDLITGINWGSITLYLEPYINSITTSLVLDIYSGINTTVPMKSYTNGAIVDFGDIDGDGTIDMIIGGHGGTSNIYIAYAVITSLETSFEIIENIYDSNIDNIGTALSANNNLLLNQINEANLNIINFLQFGTLSTREKLQTLIINHISKYSFLKYQTLDTKIFHHIPSIVVQNWIILHESLPDTPNRRILIADTMGLTGTARLIYLHSGITLGDNAKSVPEAYLTIYEFMKRHPRESFPDSVITIDQFYGDNRGGLIWICKGSKNIFGDNSLKSGNSFDNDLIIAIDEVLGNGAHLGDSFTYVLGHEATHSLAKYLKSRKNQDLRRRHLQYVSYAAGSNVIADDTGNWNLQLTKLKFKEVGLWDGIDANWNTAWNDYWSKGYGSTFKGLSVMRIDVLFFLNTIQESLSTQGNQHWANGVGRLIGAAQRYIIGNTTGPIEMKANINEVVTFIDIISCGMNRINLVETKSVSKSVIWYNHYADLERNEKGYITSIKVDGLKYQYYYNDIGIVTDFSVSGVYSP